LGQEENLHLDFKTVKSADMTATEDKRNDASVCRVQIGHRRVFATNQYHLQCCFALHPAEGLSAAQPHAVNKSPRRSCGDLELIIRRVRLLRSA
jgi:hypothetical protein